MSRALNYLREFRREFSGKSLRARTINGAAALVIGEVYSSGIRLLANLAMTRLLYPEAFGVMLVVNLVFSALAMLSDVGIRSAIISRKGELGPGFLNVAWTIMIIRGFCLGLIAALLAKPISVLYGHPELFNLILVVSLSPIISGFASPYPFIAERDVQLTKVTIWRTVTQTIATIVTLIWLLIVPSIWALAAHGVIASIVLVVLSFRFFPGARIKVQWDPVLARELFHFGKWVLVGTALTFLGRQGDSLIVSRFIGLELLGVFSIAVTFAKLIEMLAEKLSWGLLFPVYSEMKSSTADSFSRQTRKLKLAVYGLCFPIVATLSIAGRDIIGILYDPRYSQAGWMLEVMAVGLGFYVLASTVLSLPLSHEDSKHHMRLQFLRVVSVLSTMIVGAQFFGFVGLIWGMAIGQILYYPFLQASLRDYNVRHYAIDLSFGFGTIALATIVWSIRGWPAPSGF